MIFHIIHVCRSAGVQLTIADHDAIKIVDALLYEVVVFDGALLRQLVEHHLMGVALQQSLAVEVQRPLISPYRRPLARLSLDRQIQATRALARRSRKPKC